MEKWEVEKRNEELYEKYGEFNGHMNKDRMHFCGVRLSGSGPSINVFTNKEGVLHLCIGLDPWSPFGQFLGQYAIPFVPREDFHLDKVELWIYRQEDRYRVEVRAPYPRRDKEQKGEIQTIYGVSIDPRDTSYLEFE